MTDQPQTRGPSDRTPRTTPPSRRGAASRRPAKGLAADISFEEQVQIIGQINEAVQRNRIQIQADTFRYTPKRKGSPIPLLINAGALIVVLAGAYFLFRFFNREEQQLIRPPEAVQSAEERILEVFKRESEQQLAEKDQEISAIRGRLDDLRKEAERARLDSEAQIRRREVELKAELARQLEAERRRLQDSGVGAANVEQQLRALEERLRAENQRRLEDFRAQAAEELAAKERELAEREAQYRQQLQEFQQDRQSLEQRLRQREAELEAQRVSETAALESERSRTAQELASLTELRRRETAALDQVASSYSRIGTAMRARQYDAALRELSALEGFLGQEAVVALPAVQNRLPVERFVIGSLRTLIDKERSPLASAGAAAEAARAQELIAAVAAAAAEGDRLDRAGDAAGAQRFYQSAVESIPEVRQSHLWLVERARQGFQREAEGSSDAARRLRAELEQARSELRQKTQEASRLGANLQRAQELIGQQAGELERLRSAMSEQGERLAALQGSARQREAQAQEAASLRGRYAAAASGSPARAPGGDLTQERILAVVDTKVKLREVVGSEPVKSRYPELARELEDYFELYGASQLRQGQEQALKDAVAVLDNLLGKAGSLNVTAAGGRYPSAAGDPFAVYLDKLAELLR